MIRYDEGDKRFNFRVAAVLLNKDQVLLHKGEAEDFWALPGGRAELLEPSNITIKREMKEELGVEVNIERLVWVVENFFEYENKFYHELAFYYLITVPQDSLLYKRGEQFVVEDEGVKFIFKWFNLNALKKIPLYPIFLRKSLNSMPKSIEHIIIGDIASDLF